METECLDGDVWYRSQGLTDDAYEQRQSDHTQTIEVLREILAKGRLERIQPAPSQFLHLIGVEFCGNADDQRKLAWSFLETGIDTHLAVMQRDRGEVVATPPAPLFRSGSNLQSHPPQKAVNTSRTLQDCFDLWKDRRASRPKKTVFAYRTERDDLVAFAGTKAASTY